MADELDVLLGKVESASLREELRAAVDRVRAKRSFGLVFESHIPERVRLHDHAICRGVTVVRRDETEVRAEARRVDEAQVSALYDSELARPFS